MTADKLRLWVQAVSFVLLTYGGRIGIHLGYALPCFSCPFVGGCGGYCFLMLLQRVGIFGIGAFDKVFTYIGLKNMLWSVAFIVAALALSKLWCGWICPFGTVQDMLAGLRRGLGVRESELSPRVLDLLKPVKYIFLAVILLLPFLLTAKILGGDFSYFFCRICPARIIMPFFTLDNRTVWLDFSNYVNFLVSVTGILAAAVTVTGSFFKDRIFCLVCPMLPLIQICRKLSPWKFEKNAAYCSGCGNCSRVCPMDIRKVSDAVESGNVMTDECLLCTRCVRSCPENEVLALKFFSRKLLVSSKAGLIKRLLKKDGRKNVGERDK